LPSPHAIPKLLVDLADLVWFDVPDVTRGVAELIDGTRTIAVIAEQAQLALGEAQFRIADMRDRGVVSLE
jgi:hypothetical protein